MSAGLLLGRLRGARFRLRSVRFLLPFGHCASPSGGAWDAFAARDFACAACVFCCPSGTALRPPAELGTPVRRAARWGRLWGYAPFSAPLASPPKHPLRKFSIAIGWRGHASCAAGASLPRCARSGDLPPRRVNARERFRSDQSPLQPNTIMPFIL